MFAYFRSSKIVMNKCSNIIEVIESCEMHIQIYIKVNTSKPYTVQFAGMSFLPNMIGDVSNIHIESN